MDASQSTLFSLPSTTTKTSPEIDNTKTTCPPHRAMDLLESLCLSDLPEQQTRLLLDATTALQLGHDVCCTCGKEDISVTCPHCQRVRYCSKACHEKDGKALDTDEETQALGHSAIICSLLQLCNKDETVEQQQPSHNENDNTSIESPALFHTIEAACDRVRSEYESYPATLANVIMEGPCYQNVLAQQEQVVIHVVGASQDAELSRGPTVQDHSSTKVIESYAEALAELAERHDTTVNQIVLQFIGPECPSSPWTIEMPLQMLDKRVGQLRATTHQGLYHQVKNELSTPHIVVWFHPGFTVPDYEWRESLHSIAPGTPFLFTSNTEMEAIADTQFLLEQDSIQELPAGLADILEVVVSSTEHTFFAVNPFSGLRVRQNEALANDVYVKNRWMLGGVLGPLVRPDPEGELESKRVKKKPNAALI